MADFIDDATLNRAQAHLYQLGIEMRGDVGPAGRNARNALRYLTADTEVSRDALRLILSVVKGIAYDDQHLRRLIRSSYNRGINDASTNESDAT